MNALASELPRVLDPTLLEDLGDDILRAATRLNRGMHQANVRWQHLGTVFSVGPTPVVSLLTGSLHSAEQLEQSMIDARRVLGEYARFTFPALRARRRDLARRIASASPGGTPSPAPPAGDGCLTAVETSDAEAQALDDLRADVERFCRDVEEAESALAHDLDAITGGEDARGPWGVALTISQAYWGEGASPYHRAAPTDHNRSGRGLAAIHRERLSTAVTRRLEWAAQADPAAVTRWLRAHGDFSGTIGFVDPHRAARLWEGWRAASARGADGEWGSGPLAQLRDIAPSAVGNLNGVPAVVRDEFNRAALRSLLNDPSSRGEALAPQSREKLERLAELLNADAEEGAPRVTLISLFLDAGRGEPRASIGFGRVDSADQVTTLTHGISTDVAHLEEWADSAVKLQQETAAELERRGSSAVNATVLFMEWDSGGMFTVHGIGRPDSGAERLAQTLRGFQTVNPDAQLNLGLHSLGTTMGTQMMADELRGDAPRTVDNAWLFGSAGVTEQTADALAHLPGDTDVYATHAERDWVAPFGRFGSSEHAANPLDVQGIHSFSSEGGEVRLPGGGSVHGEQVGGHNTRLSDSWLYRIEAVEPIRGRYAIPSITLGDDSVGYLDPNSRSFRQTVIDLADELISSTRVER
jgi:hypothetical protein